MPLRRLLAEHDSADIAEYMAYDLTLDPEFVERFERDQQFQKNRALTPEQREARYDKLLGG